MHYIFVLVYRHAFIRSSVRPTVHPFMHLCVLSVGMSICLFCCLPSCQPVNLCQMLFVSVCLCPACLCGSHMNFVSRLCMSLPVLSMCLQCPHIPILRAPCKRSALRNWLTCVVVHLSAYVSSNVHRPSVFVFHIKAFFMGCFLTGVFNRL